MFKCPERLPKANYKETKAVPPLAEHSGIIGRNIKISLLNQAVKMFSGMGANSSPTSGLRSDRNHPPSRSPIHRNISPTAQSPPFPVEPRDVYRTADFYVPEKPRSPLPVKGTLWNFRDVFFGVLRENSPMSSSMCTKKFTLNSPVKLLKSGLAKPNFLVERDFYGK